MIRVRARVTRSPGLIVLLLLAFPGLGSAQDAATGGLRVLIVDASGAAVAGAEVVVRGRAGDARRAVSDGLGEVELPALPPDAYTVRVEAKGFSGVTLPDVAVAVGRTVRLQAGLALQTFQQSVEVVAALPSLDGALDGNVSPDDVAGLPIDGRRFQALAALTPLAATEDAPEFVTDAATGEAVAATDTDAARIVMHATDPVQNRYRLEGLSLTRSFDGEPRGGRTVPFAVPQEAVREFQVRPVGVDDAAGQAAGGAVHTVLRRGGAAVHGTAFVLSRTSAVGASNPFSVVTRYNAGAPTVAYVQPHDERWQFGGSVGGGVPLTRRRLFGFVAAEGQRREFDAVSSPSDPAFFQLTAVQAALLANRGVNTAAVAKGLAFLDGLTGNVPRRADEFALTPRVDAVVPVLGQVSTGWLRVRFRSPAGANSSPVVPLGRASVRDVVTHSDTVFFSLASAVGSRWLNTLRAEYSRDAVFSSVPMALASEPHTAPDGSSPEVPIGGVFRFGNAGSRSARRLPDERSVEVNDAVQWAGRAHTLTMGLNVNGIDERIGAREQTNGAYDYSSGAVNGRAGGLVDFLTDYTYSVTNYPNGGCPSIFAAVHFFCFRSFTQGFGAVAETRFHTVESSAFAGDVWRPTPNVSISAGVRYEYVRMPPAQHANAALDAVFGDFAATGNTPRDTNNLAPHAGVAYAMGARTAVRVGYGYRFGRLPGRMLQAGLENTAMPASVTQIRVGPRTVIDPACASAGTNFGYPATYACSPFGPVTANGAATVFARGLQLPAMQTGEVSVTRELPWGFVATASYAANVERQLPNTTDLNIAPSTARVAFRIVRTDGGGGPGLRNGEVFNVPLYTARRSALFGPVTAIVSNGTGSYHAGVLALQRGLRGGLSVRLQWTYAKAIDSTRVTGAAPDADSQFDPVDPLYDRAASVFDQRHRVIAHGLWQPTLRRGGRGLRAVANGWTVAPIVLAHTGRPFSYLISGGTALEGGRTTLNGSGGATYVPTVGRNTVHLPWTVTTDLRVTRAVRLRDVVTVRATAEAFNLLNHVNATGVEERAFLTGVAGTNGVVPLVYQDAAAIAAEGLTGRAFGVANASAGSPARERRLQFGLRVEW